MRGHKHTKNCRTRFETSTASFDPALQITGSDAEGSFASTGITIPKAQPHVNAPTTRYLFLLASAKFDQGVKGRLVGMRQLVTIGLDNANTTDTTPSDISPIELEVQSPLWRFPDGNISWFLRRVPLNRRFNANTLNTVNLQYRNADVPALLFETTAASADGYTPPDGGRAPGNILVPDLANFKDLRFPWRSGQSWSSLDAAFEGPCAVELYASVQQTKPSTRTVFVPQATPLFDNTAMRIEDRFVLNFPSARYYRIAGSLIFETENCMQTCDLPDTTVPVPVRPPGNGGQR